MEVYKYDDNDDDEHKTTQAHIKIERRETLASRTIKPTVVLFVFFFSSSFFPQSATPMPATQYAPGPLPCCARASSRATQSPSGGAPTSEERGLAAGKRTASDGIFTAAFRSPSSGHGSVIRGQLERRRRNREEGGTPGVVIAGPLEVYN